MRSLKTPQALAQAAQIGKLIESTITAAAQSRDPDRMAAADWWKGKLGRVLAQLQQEER